MKGKSIFGKQEVQLIESLIEDKLKATSEKQKGIRDRIRKLGFYATDFGVGNGYTVADFLRVVTIDGKLPISSVIKPSKIGVMINSKNTKALPTKNVESYIIDLCDEFLKDSALRQHRFDFLKGDTGVKLPVDAYYPKLKLVIEYHERQHTEEVKFFDKRITSSGIGRGEQRKLYDDRRRIEIPNNGLDLIIFNYSEFAHGLSKRLFRNEKADIEVIREKLEKYI